MYKSLILSLAFITSLSAHANNRNELQASYEQGINEGFIPAYEERKIVVFDKKQRSDSGLFPSSAQALTNTKNQITIMIPDQVDTGLRTELLSLRQSGEGAKLTEKCFADLEKYDEKQLMYLKANLKAAGNFTGHLLGKLLGRQPLFSYFPLVKICDKLGNQNKLLNYRDGVLHIGVPAQMRSQFNRRTAPKNLISQNKTMFHYLTEWEQGQHLLIGNKKYTFKEKIFKGMKGELQADIILRQKMQESFWTVLNPIGSVAQRLKRRFYRFSLDLVKDIQPQCRANNFKSKVSELAETLNSISLARFQKRAHKSIFNDSRHVKGKLFAFKNSKNIIVNFTPMITNHSMHEAVSSDEPAESEALQCEQGNVNEANHTGSTESWGFAFSLVDDVKVNVDASFNISSGSKSKIKDMFSICE